MPKVARPQFATIDRVDGELCAYSTYFKGAWDALNTNGIFVLDIFGGTDTSKDMMDDISTHEITLDDGR